MRQRATKAPLTFEILVTTRDQERIALAYSRDLKRAGIEVSVRAVDPVQFDQRRLGYEFDMLQNRFARTLGDRLHDFFQHARRRGSNELPDGLGSEPAVAGSNRLIKDGKRIAHGTIAGFSEQGQRVFVRVNAFTRRQVF